MPEYAPCKECGEMARTPVRYVNHTICGPCIEKRRREGRNRVERPCKGCQKKLYPEARQLIEWDGFCPACRTADLIERGAVQVTRFNKKGEPFTAYVLPDGLKFETFVATRSITVAEANVRIPERACVLFNGVVAEVNGHRFEAPTLNGAVQFGWLKPGLPSRFDREDVI